MLTKDEGSVKPAQLLGDFLRLSPKDQSSSLIHTPLRLEITRLNFILILIISYTMIKNVF